jgi:hypothetical protein
MNNEQNNQSLNDKKYYIANNIQNVNQIPEQQFYEEEENTEIHLDQDDAFNYPSEQNINQMHMNTNDNCEFDNVDGFEQNNYQYQEEEERSENQEYYNDYTQQDQYNQINTNTLQEMQTNPHNNNIENSNENNREPIYIMTLELEEGKATNIQIFSDTNPEELAYQLCNDYGLDYQAMEFLQEEITKLMEMNMNNLDQNPNNNQYQENNCENIEDPNQDNNDESPNNNKEMEGILEEEEYENNENRKEEINNDDLEFLNIGENQIYTFKEANERGQSHDMTESVAQEEAIEINDGENSIQTNIKEYGNNYNNVEEANYKPESNLETAKKEERSEQNEIEDKLNKFPNQVQHISKNSAEVNNFVVRDHELKYYEGDTLDRIDITSDENYNTILNKEGKTISLLDSALHSKTSSSFINPDPKANLPTSKIKHESVSSEDTKSTVLLYSCDSTVRRPEEVNFKNIGLEHRNIKEKDKPNQNLNIVSNSTAKNFSENHSNQLYYLDFSDNNIQSSNIKYNIIEPDDNNITAKVRGSHLNTINSEEEVQETQNSNVVNENNNNISINNSKNDYKIKNDSKVFSLKEEDINNVIKNEDQYNPEIINLPNLNASSESEILVKSAENTLLNKEKAIENTKHFKNDRVQNNSKATVTEKPNFYKVDIDFHNNLNQIQLNEIIDKNYNSNTDNNLAENNEGLENYNKKDEIEDHDYRNIEIYKSPTETPTNVSQVRPNDRYKLPINRRSINVNDSINITLNENNRNNFNNFPLNNGNGIVANVEMLPISYSSNDNRINNEASSNLNIEASREVLINPSARELIVCNEGNNLSLSKRDNKEIKGDTLIESINKDYKNLHEVKDLENMPSKIDQLNKRNLNKESICSKKTIESKKSSKTNQKVLNKNIEMNNKTVEENNNLISDNTSKIVNNTSNYSNYKINDHNTNSKTSNFQSNLQQRINNFEKSNKYQYEICDNSNKTISISSQQNNLNNFQNSYQSNYNSKRHINNQSQKQTEDVFNKLYEDASRRRSCKASQRNRSLTNDDLKASGSKLNISGISKDKNVSKQFSEMHISQTQNKSYKQIRENSISNRSGSVKNKQYLNKGEALYYEGLKQKEAFKNKIDKLKSERILNSKTNCTFQPNSHKVDGIKGYNKNNISHVMCYINKLNSKVKNSNNEEINQVSNSSHVNNSNINYSNKNNQFSSFIPENPTTHQSDINTSYKFVPPSNFSSDLKVNQKVNYSSNNENKNVNTLINSAYNSYNKYHYSSNMLLNSRIYDSKEYIKNKENLLQKLREKHTLPDDVEDCTFKPQISAASNNIITNLNPENYLSRKMKKQEKIIEECTKELTFIPKTQQQVLTSQGDKPYQKLSFEERQLLYKEISENKRKDLNEMYSKYRDGKTGQELFKPKLCSSKGKYKEKSRPKTGDINQVQQKIIRDNNFENNVSNNYMSNNNTNYKEKNDKSKEKIQNEKKNVYETNYNYAITYTNKKKELEKRIRNHEEHKSALTSSSNQIFEKMKNNAIENLFNHLDSDQDNKITRIHINLNNISTRGLKIINPIITELKDQNETLNSFEFKLAMNELFNVRINLKLTYYIRF